MAVYILATITRLCSLYCYSHTHHILAHWHTPLHYTNLQTKNPAQACTRLHKPTNPYMPTTHTYSTSTQHYIPTLPLHTCTTTQHIPWSTLRSGPAPAHMLNEHVAGQWGGYLLVIKYYVLRHLLGIILCLKCLEAPEEGKSIKFPRKHAILADCTTMETSPPGGVSYLLCSLMKNRV